MSLVQLPHQPALEDPLEVRNASTPFLVSSSAPDQPSPEDPLEVRSTFTPFIVSSSAPDQPSPEDPLEVRSTGQVASRCLDVDILELNHEANIKV